jgi:tetratricopeptide (TPR) repeat protein
MENPMRRTALLGVLTTLLISLLLSGCSKESPPPPAEPPSVPPPRPAPDAAASSAAAPIVVQAEPSRQEQFDAALLNALNLLADHKYPEALASLQAAKTLQDADKDQVQQLIDKVQNRIDQQAAARSTAQDIQTVLQEGKSDEAAPLATAALGQYGGSDQAEPLAQLKREADTLAAVQLSDDAARRDRFRRDGDAALRDRNLRAAALAFEQALSYGDDVDVRRQLDEVRATLSRYDDNFRRAVELRRDPVNLEEAIAALQEAAKAWDTLEVRQELDLYTLALQKRRDRLSVADFETRGDVGIPGAGRTVAEGLLPHFKPRFDLVEREQVGKIIDELKLEATTLAANDSGCRQIGQLAKARFLVVGSVTRLSGITVQARMVDVRTGLVVQTAQVVAATPDDLLPLLPRLANLLMMTDEQKMAYEQQLAQQAAVQPVVIAPLPPPPEVTVGPPPPPLIVCTPRPPDFGGFCPDDLNRVSAAVVVEREEPVKRRILQVALEIGDNLFRRGRYREAQTHFALALSLLPGHAEISLRIDRCRPYLPPPPPPQVVVAPPPVVADPAPLVVVAVPPPRPRIAILNFLVDADPALAPPGLGDWAAQQLACYFSPTYEIADRGELFWWMGRMGMTVRDVLTDASARRWLGRALNVRFFVFGVVQQTHSFDVSTHLIDVETGSKQGVGSIHVQDHTELKLRMHELARQALSNPVESERLQREAKENEARLNEARRLLKEGKAAQAVTVCRAGLQQHPENVGLRALLQQAEEQTRQQALAETRRREAEAHRAQAEAAQQRQRELARRAEAARAEAEKAARSDADRQAREQQRERAQQRLLAQGEQALRQQNYPQAIQALESAIALKASDDARRKLALARAGAEEAARARATAEQTRRAAELRGQREAELAQARAQVAEEQRRRTAEEQAQRKVQEERDQTAYAKLLDEGRRLLAQGKYDAAVSALQNARQLRKTDEVERVLSEAREKQAKAQAQARVDLVRRQAEEKARREQADQEQKRQEEARRSAQVKQLVTTGRTALSAKQFDVAARALGEASKLAPSDPEVVKAQRDLEQARNAAEKARAAQEAEARKQQDEQKRRAEAARLTAQGQAAMTAKRYDEAVRAFSEALRLQPGDAGLTKALREATQALDATKGRQPPPKPQPPAPQPKTEPSRPAAPAPPTVATQAEYGRQMQTAAALDKQQKYAESIRAYKEALRLIPGDARATASLRNAEFAQHMAEGQKALSAKRFADATREFEEALKLSPGNQAAMNGLKQARAGR